MANVVCGALDFPFSFLLWPPLRRFIPHGRTQYLIACPGVWICVAGLQKTVGNTRYTKSICYAILMYAMVLTGGLVIYFLSARSSVLLSQVDLFGPPFFCFPPPFAPLVLLGLSRDHFSPFPLNRSYSYLHCWRVSSSLLPIGETMTLVSIGCPSLCLYSPLFLVSMFPIGQVAKSRESALRFPVFLTPFLSPCLVAFMLLCASSELFQPRRQRSSVWKGDRGRVAPAGSIAGKPVTAEGAGATQENLQEGEGGSAEEEEKTAGGTLHPDGAAGGESFENIGGRNLSSLGVVVTSSSGQVWSNGSLEGAGQQQSVGGSGLLRTGESQVRPMTASKRTLTTRSSLVPDSPQTAGCCSAFWCCGLTSRDYAVCFCSSARRVSLRRIRAGVWHPFRH